MRTTIAAVAAALIALAPLAAPAQTVAAGAVLSGTLNQDISSKDAQVGQTFSMSGVHTSSGNATIYGHVSEVERAGQGKRPQVQLAYDRIVMPNGSSQAITGVTESAKVNTKNNTTREVIGAVVGDVAGNILGKSVLHTNLGGIVGAAGGFLYAKNYHENVTIPKGSAVSVRLTSARRQAQSR